MGNVNIVWTKIILDASKHFKSSLCANLNMSPTAEIQENTQSTRVMIYCFIWSKSWIKWFRQNLFFFCNMPKFTFTKYMKMYMCFITLIHIWSHFYDMDVNNPTWNDGLLLNTRNKTFPLLFGVFILLYNMWYICYYNNPK